MTIPAWHVAVLASLYAAEYFRRAWTLKEKKFMLAGKGFGRMLIAGVYFYIAFYNPAEALKIVLVRWSLTVFLLVELFFIAQEHVMRWRFSGNGNQSA